MGIRSRSVVMESRVATIDSDISASQGDVRVRHEAPWYCLGSAVYT